MKLRVDLAGVVRSLRAIPPSTLLKWTLSAALSAASLWVTAHVFLRFNDPFLFGGVSFDESHFVWGGWCINKGLVPYRDFLEFKPPFVFLTHALALKLYGYSQFGYRKLFAYLPLASLLALQLSMISRGIDKLLSLVLVIAIVHLWLNPELHDVALSDSESIGLTYFFLAVAFLTVKAPWRNLTDSIGGAFLVACILSKEPFLPCAGLTWISCFLIGERTSSLRADGRRYVKWTFLGAAIVVAALCIYMVPTGAMREYIKMMRGYFHFYRDPMQSYCVVLGRFHPTTPLNDLVLQYEQARREFVNSTTLGYLVPFGVAALAFTARRSALLIALTIAGCFFALYAVTASNCQWMHYYNMTMSGLFFFLIVGLDSMTPHFWTVTPTMRTFLRFALAGVIAVQVWPRLEAEDDLYGTRNHPSEYPEPFPGVLESIQKYTLPSDRIFTSGAPSLYVEANRISAIRESAIVDETLGYYEGNTDEERLSGLRAQLERNMPKLVFTDPDMALRKVRTNRALITPFLNEHHYTQIKGNIWLRPD